jgi:diamine N-acetyltransferase
VITIESRRLLLKEIQDDDIGVLFQFRNSEPFLKNCTFKGPVLSESDFLEELKGDFAFDRHLQMMIVDKASERPLGTIYSYDYNPVDEYAFMSMFVQTDIAGRWTAAEATTAFVFYLFDNFKLFKIYADVYGYNKDVLSVFRRKIFKEEGLFRGHRKKEGERIDVHRFALYRDELRISRKLYNKLVIKKT